MSIRVTEADGKAIPRAEVIVETHQGKTTVPAGDDGVARISFPAGPRDFLRVIATAPGRTPAMAMWWMQAKSPELLPPNQMTFELRSGKRIGGVLLGPDDEPIAGATVLVSLKAADGPPGLVYRAGRTEHGPWQVPVVTDESGCWRYDGAPAEWREAFVQPQHPDYHSPDTVTNKSDAREALLDCSDVTRMERGRTVRGRVVDQNGKAVPEAHIWLRPSSFRTPAASTNQDGEVEVKQASSREFQILVTSKDRFAPQFVQVTADGQDPSLRIKLESPQSLSIHVVDANARPIAGAFARVFGWGTDRTSTMALYAEAAADGRFEFAVPDTPVELVVGAEGYATQVPEELDPKGSPHVIELSPARRLRGTVVDATGNRIDKFYVCYSRDGFDDKPWDPPVHEAFGGSYEVLVQEELDTCRVRIEAPGYKAVESDYLPIERYEAVFDAVLQRED